MRKLLDRIRSQRSQWLELETPAELAADVREEIPEKDTTIHTGSLSSEEKSSMLPVEHPGKVAAQVMIRTCLPRST